MRFIAGAFTRRTEIPVTVQTSLAQRYPRALETVLSRLVHTASRSLRARTAATSSPWDPVSALPAIRPNSGSFGTSQSVAARLVANGAPARG